MKRTIIHYVIAGVIMTIYGGQVCPFLESLTIVQLAGSLAVVLFAMLLGQAFLASRFINRLEYKFQSKRIFQFQLLGFIAGGFVLLFFNTLYYRFPVLSGAKLVLSFTLLGFFSSVDLSLEKEWQLNRIFAETGKWFSPDDQYFSHPKKMVIIATISLLLTTGVVFLVINKDLDWLTAVGSSISLQSAQQSILGELAFVFAVILLYLINIIFSYSRNFRNFLQKETVALQKATNGDFTTFVPVGSNDEFGIMAQYTNLMVEGLKERTDELQKTRDVTILALASLAETRDNETGNHILRTQQYVRALAEYLKSDSVFADHLDEETIQLLHKSAALHDIGKVGIPDHILLKPGKLTDEEFEIMKTHTLLGAETLKTAEERLGKNSFLSHAREIAVTHHEKWDGSGYPFGLKKDEIPLSGRLMSLADVYDALISKRVYKPAFSHEKARGIIKEWREQNFDPIVVDAFFAIEDQFVQIADAYRDNE